MSPGVTRESSLDVIDIRGGELQTSLLDEINRGLRPQLGVGKQLPTMLLYDAKGLKLFEDITYLDEYYLTNAEIEVLESYSDQIARLVPQGALMVELGSGNLRKVGILLKALDRAKKDIDYYALDLSLSELYRTLGEVDSFEYVRCHGLHGTYNDGFAWLKKAENQQRPRCVLSLGSSIGNFNRTEDVAFLGEIRNALGPGDVLIIGTDGCQNGDKVWHAYNDRHGITQEFYWNGLRHANKILGKELFKKDDWDVVGEYNQSDGRHQAFVIPRRSMTIDGFEFTKGERVFFEYSHKYSLIQRSQLWTGAGLQLMHSFADKQGEYFVNMLSVSDTNFPSKPRDYAASPVPSLQEFRQLWALWDVVTLQMIPRDSLLEKPINLRNCCLFYLGHIPTFLDMHITRATDGSPTEPSSYPRIFERGIDPDVDDPSMCHAHSEIPTEWPPVEEIADFQARVRERTTKIYEDGSVETNMKVGRAMWLAFEHEAMHLETLLYMLLQSNRTLPPPGPRPDFESIAKQARANSKPNTWFRIPDRKITIGLNDPETNNGPSHYFGWDCEKPERTVAVAAFEAQARPITNGEYAQYMSECKIDKCPQSWTSQVDSGLQNGARASYLENLAQVPTLPFVSDKAVKTVYGPVPFGFAIDWPVMASYDELAGCAKWMGGRIPTAEEARSLYGYANELDTAAASTVSARTIPAVNGQVNRQAPPAASYLYHNRHLSNNGVQETPPSHPLHEKSSSDTEQNRLDPNALFVDLTDCNVGFKHFHPMPVVQNGDKLAGLSGLGGVWECTSTVLERHEGYQPMELYPAYSSDFFDGKHNIVLGGSWATHPRLAGRKTFVNWYQHNYPYAWLGARVVRDL